MNRELSQSVLLLIAINVVLFVIKNLQPQFAEQLIGSYVFSPNFKIWQVLTHMFMHANVQHLLFNMFGLWMFGDAIAKRIGDRRFISFYLICGLAAFALYTGVLFAEYGTQPYIGGMLGASGAVYGVVVAYAMLYPNAKLMMIFLPIPIAAKYFVPGILLLDLVLGVSGASTGVAHFAHIGGAIAGGVLMFFMKKRLSL